MNAMEEPEDPEALERRLGYTFRDRALLERALMRPARAHEEGLPDEAHQEALATLGDAIISVIVIQSAIHRGMHKKGEITAEKMRTVSLLSLNEVGRALHLQTYIRFNKGERKQRIWECSDALTETLEAIVGAIYLDGGMERAAEALHSVLRMASEDPFRGADRESAPERL
ncbi:MAG: ribonuclease III [Methanomicrobiaceae archaeon]|uniref:Ribonuclease iii n=1 Tax=hydrocarbon metagenome TaxID=938273 RepID=A0A0W8FEJ2_9ZZZZ|nr:ribonuclease III [Methanomicrobiaceae archaeon]MDD5418920.1 ribonuclease III domain-containing protein [Methanomicrobiaceae archaeon]